MQVLASPQTVPASSERFKSYRGKVKQYTADGKYRYKYCVGEYETRAAAQKQLAAVRKVLPRRLCGELPGNSDREIKTYEI